MATAGVVAVGMPVLAAVEAAVAPPLPFPDHLLGDVFIKINDVWRFLGKLTTLEVRIEQDVTFADLASFDRPTRKEKAHVSAGEVDVDIMLDSEGRRLLMDAFARRLKVDFAMSQGENGLYTLKESLIREMSTTTHRELVTESFALELGDVEVTFPTAEAA